MFKTRYSIPLARRMGFTKGMTLVEVIIAVSILGIMATAVVSAMIMGSKMTRLNTNAIMAKNIAQGLFEQLNAIPFASVGSPNTSITTATTATNPIYLDRANDIKCAVTSRFTGFGVTTATGTGSITDSSADWTPGEWVGHRVCIVAANSSGLNTGVGCTGIISANTATVITATGFTTTPAVGTRYMIDNGKTVKITTKWNYLGKDYSQTVSSLVVYWRGASALGF